MRKYHIQSAGQEIKKSADCLHIDSDGLQLIEDRRIVAIFKVWDFCVEIGKDQCKSALHEQEWEANNIRNDK